MRLKTNLCNLRQFRRLFKKICQKKLIYFNCFLSFRSEGGGNGDIHFDGEGELEIHVVFADHLVL